MSRTSCCGWASCRLPADATSAPCMMAAFPTFANLAPKTKNLIVAGGLSAFVFGVYFYTMKAVGGTDELQVAINMFEEEKHKQHNQALRLPNVYCVAFFAEDNGLTV